jgi:hypothetical protein
MLRTAAILLIAFTSESSFGGRVIAVEVTVRWARGGRLTEAAVRLIFC